MGATFKLQKREGRERERETLLLPPHWDAAIDVLSPSLQLLAHNLPPLSVVTEDGISDHNGPRRHFGLH